MVSAIRFWLPPEDRDLVGTHSTRDPLGLLPIWSQRGRSVVTNMTEQTNHVAGFQLLVTTLRLWEEFQNWSPDARVRVEEFFLLTEQAFAYSTFSRTETWPLPGRERIVQFIKNGAPQLSLKNGILANQLGNGVWGLYRGAALRSGILHDSTRRLSAAFSGDMTDSGLSRRSKKELFGQILEAVNNREEGAEFSLHHGRNLPTDMGEIINTIPNKALLRRYLLPHGSLQTRVAALLFKNRKLFAADPAYRRVFINLCAREFTEEREPFEWILRCEDLIAPVERVFYFLFKFAGERVAKAASGLDVDLKDIAVAQERFATSGIYTGGTAGRYAIYRDSLRLTSREDLVRSILSCHQKVAADRGREPWIVEENDRLRSFVQYDGFPDELDAKPGQTWNNDYYLRPLLAIYTGLRS